MIPPLQALRLKSIDRWLLDSEPNPTPNDRSLEAQRMDEEMIEDFEQRDQALIASLEKANRWGTDEGLRQYRTDRLTLWQEVAAEYLPVLTSEPSEQLAR